MKFKLFILLFTILLLGFSCGGDDDDGIVEVPEADRTEQQVIDNDSLVSFLQSHYVDESLLTNNPAISFNDIETDMVVSLHKNTCTHICFITKTIQTVTKIIIAVKKQSNK